MHRVQPIYLESDDQTSLALFHAAGQGGSNRSSVLICPPWGWDEVASYRTRRKWAQRLAESGHPTLRLELPATGDSGGTPADAGLVDSWIGAIAAAASWLKSAGGGSPLVALGLGLGGLLGLESLTAGAPIDEMALWAMPALGRGFVRETRAFSRLQAWQVDDDSAELAAGLPEGWLEAGGFTLSAETMESLAALDSRAGGSPALRRALLLDRDGIAVDRGLRERLERGGVEVSLAPGVGWGEMVSHPERSRLPLNAAERFEAWLDAGRTPPGDAPAGRAEAPVAAERIELSAGGSDIHESPLILDQPWGQAFGVLVSPTADRVPDLVAVFLNAGAVREIGPSRIWVETSRAWAGQGVPGLRLDLEGIGEADGPAAGSLRVADFYDSKYQGQITAALDALIERGVGRRFVLVGLCAGGYWSFRTAVADRRVGVVLAINAGALRWSPDLLAEREARKAGRALQRHWWAKLIRGDVGLRKVGRLAGSMLVRVARSLRRLGSRAVGRGGDPLSAGIEADLDALRESGTRVVIAFSGEEPLGHEVMQSAIPGQLARWPETALLDLPGSDHTLRPIAAQVAVRELLDGELARELAPGAVPRSR
ncbi:MAG: hypothetical protein H0X42_09725 [Solirubrobacterales bacterium]|nr:hypothetical protein [Solirubrobacterales bacterium]